MAEAEIKHGSDEAESGNAMTKEELTRRALETEGKLTAMAERIGMILMRLEMMGSQGRGIVADHWEPPQRPAQEYVQERMAGVPKAMGALGSVGIPATNPALEQLVATGDAMMQALRWLDDPETAPEHRPTAEWFCEQWIQAKHNARR